MMKDSIKKYGIIRYELSVHLKDDKITLSLQMNQEEKVIYFASSLNN